MKNVYLIQIRNAAQFKNILPRQLINLVLTRQENLNSNESRAL